MVGTRTVAGHRPGRQWRRRGRWPCLFESGSRVLRPDEEDRRYSRLRRDAMLPAGWQERSLNQGAIFLHPGPIDLTRLLCGPGSDLLHARASVCPSIEIPGSVTQKFCFTETSRTTDLLRGPAHLRTRL